MTSKNGGTGAFLSIGEYTLRMLGGKERGNSPVHGRRQVCGVVDCDRAGNFF